MAAGYRELIKGRSELLGAQRVGVEGISSRGGSELAGCGRPELVFVRGSHVAQGAGNKVKLTLSVGASGKTPHPTR